MLSVSSLGRFSLSIALALCLVQPALLLLCRRSDRLGSIQLRFSPMGCVQIDNVNGPSALVELFGLIWWVIPLSAAVALVLLLRGHRLDLWKFTVWILVLAIWGMNWWKQSRAIRRAVRQVREGDIADASVAFRPLTPWTEINHVHISTITANRHRLQVEGKARSQIIFPIDAEISCTVDQTIELEELLKQWIADASHGEG